MRWASRPNRVAIMMPTAMNDANSVTQISSRSPRLAIERPVP
jgi:hypothetical protein